MSVHKIATGYKVAWRAAGHTQKCKPGCVKTMHQHTRTFDGQPEATRWDDRMRQHVSVSRDLAEPVGILAARPGSVRTFRALALDTIVERQERGKWSAGTAAGMRTALRKLGNWAEQPITAASVDLRGAQAIVSAAKYPDRIISVIKATCDHATREGDISSHSMSALEADRSRMPDARRDFILATPAQLERVMAELDSDRPGLGLALGLMRFCGLRTGEALAVERGDFNADFSVLTLRRQADCDGVTTTLKSKRSDAVRILPVPAGGLAGTLRDRLAKHCAGLTGERLFTSATGRAVDRDRFGQRCHAGAVAAGLADGWTAYQMRHQYASVLLSRGVPIDKVARMLGHASTAVTYRHYAHLLPGDLDTIGDAAA
jgi:integrase